MLTLDDALDRTGMKQKINPMLQKSNLNNINSNYRSPVQSQYSKNAELQSAIAFVNQMRNTQLNKLDEQRKTKRKNDMSQFNKLGESPEDKDRMHVEKTVQPPSVDKFHKEDVQPPVAPQTKSEQQAERKPSLVQQKTDEEIRDSVKKAAEINKKIGSSMTVDTPTDELMNSVLNELF